MEPLYTFRAQYTLEEYKKYNWTVLFTSHYILVFILVIISCFFNGILKWDWYTLIAMLLTLLLFVWILNRVVEKTYRSNMLIQDTELTYEFYDDHFLEKSSRGEAKVEYRLLHKVIENKTHFYLFIATNQAYILKKEAMPNGLENFLEKVFLQNNVKKVVKSYL